MPVAELKLGDIIQCFEGPFGTGVIQGIEGDMVKVFRPYAKTDDFSYTGGVICYTGIEHYAFWKSEKREVFVYRRGNLK